MESNAKCIARYISARSYYNDKSYNQHIVPTTIASSSLLDGSSQQLSVVELSRLYLRHHQVSRVIDPCLLVFDLSPTCLTLCSQWLLENWLVVLVAAREVEWNPL
ncbi:hypothetical protein RRG08_014370 [Elysia crispata]|uniref:Uncharacterized protein n=1 Tax=Elysia crispata TaxID=231223 RepID=A0AAE1D2I0_9GAST|nr:hypothetical protein RRG08_014370 [Elysia crispata]